MADCPFCGSALAPGPPWAPGEGYRLAYDPQKGRLWNVCTACSRWTLTPLESRWETLEECEGAVRREGRVRFSSPQLSLVAVEEGELIRVGKPPRTEFVDWRYGPRLELSGEGRGFWARLLSKLPAPPVGGYDPYRGFEGAMRSEPWFASPFLEGASALTYLFSQVPLAPVCPSCQGPLALRPWEFQRLALFSGPGDFRALTSCALCETDVQVPLAQVRPTLRIGLGLVTPQEGIRRVAAGAAEELDRLGGPQPFLASLSRAPIHLGELDLPATVGLLISLDELAEMEALEAEWRAAEELAGIMDGELSDVPGFEAFREKILGEGT